MNRVRFFITIVVVGGLVAACRGLKLNPYNLDTRVVPLPFNTPISYDDFTYDAHLNRVLIPAGETGKVALIDPTNMNVQILSGFSEQTDINTPIVGTTAVAVAGGFLFGLDQYKQAIKTIDLSTGNMVASTPLQDAPDYIRYMTATGELWVTEKASSQIEIFSVSADTPPVIQTTSSIQIPNGPEGLIVDEARGLAFTNRPKQGITDVIDVRTHSVIREWGNGCSQARGMAVDENEGYLFVACGEGKIVVMDINKDGDQITSQNYGGNLDFVAYNPKLHHIYLPSSVSGILAIFQLQTLPATPIAPPAAPPTSDHKTSLLLIGTADTATNANCVTADNDNNIWVCNPNNGQVFVIHDTFPDTGSIP